MSWHAWDASDDRGEVVIVDMDPRRGLEALPAAAPAPASQALTPWAVDLAGGAITIGGAEIDPVIARDLWTRLGAVLGQAERDADQAAWEGLAREVDRTFAAGIPATGRTIARRPMAVDGVVVRTDEGAAFRVATFALATLRQTSKGVWEGAVYELRPTSVGHDRRWTGMRVRLADEALPRPVLAIVGPAPEPMPIRPVPVPVAPAHVLAHRAAVAAGLAELLDTFGELGTRRTLEELAAGGRWRRKELLGRLEVLVERGELRAIDGEDGPAWVRREPPARGTRVVRKHGTVIVDAVDGKILATKGSVPAKASRERSESDRSKPAPRPRGSAPKAPVRYVPPPPPPCRVWRCAPCDRVVRIPDHVEVPAEPKCGQCKGLLARWTS